MKKLSTLLLIFCTIGVFSQTQPKKLKAYLNEKQFFTPNGGNYLETQILFVGYTLNYATKNGLTQGEVEITQIISKEDSIIVADKYRLKTPEVIDSLVEDFYDIQRYALPNGIYTYELILSDVAVPDQEVSVKKKIVVEDLSKDISVSDITLSELIRVSDTLNVFNKMGYDIIPMLTNYYPTELNIMPYYVEIYNTASYLEDSVYVVQQRIFDVNQKIDLPQFNRYFKIKKTQPVQPLAKAIDISYLPSGKYVLEINVLSRDKQIIASNLIDFERNNTKIVEEIDFEDEIIDPAFTASVTDDSLDYYVASLIPISAPAEVKNIISILKKRDNEVNRKYLQKYWKSTNALQSFENWIKYKQQVQLVERLYSSNFQSGFETDRGRVYLQYGAPSSIMQRPNSPTEFPYEIWQYDKIGIQSNKRFVFYNPNLVNNAYELLHSDVRGELQNYRWQFYIRSRSRPNNLDATAPAERQGSNADRDFNTY
ncbi:MAG: GWxTD domain-containing protein [Lishizhenia sp.]